MRIIQIPGSTADRLGAVNLDAIATLRRAIILPDGVSEHHNAKAYRPGDNVPNAMTVALHSLARGFLVDAAEKELRKAIQEHNAGGWLEAEGEAVASLISTAHALLDAFGGDVPDYLRGEAEALAAALETVEGPQS
jgi:hypothetical protein